MNKWIWIIAVLGIFSCKNESVSKLTPKPTAFGRINDVVAIADKNLWDTNVKDQFLYHFGSAYPIMPTPEPIFDVRYFNTEEVLGDPIKRELRTYVILANLADTDSPATTMVRRDLGEEKFKKAVRDTSFFSTAGTDKWARGQLVTYIFGNGIDELNASIGKAFPAIAARIKKHDQQQLESNVYSIQGENTTLERQLQENFGIDIKVPGEYKTLVDFDDNFVLLKREVRDYTQTIVMRKFDYVDAKQFSKESIIQMRNDYGKQFITGSSEESYMRTNTEDLPVYEYSYQNNGSYVIEIRGVWELVNDFVGGPFATYVIHNKDRGELVFIDTFVYAPNKTKRDYMQQLEVIAKTAKVLGQASEE